MKLKKCPFCGGDGRLDVMRFEMEDFDRYGVGCPVCAVWFGWFEDKDEPIKRWNRRKGKYETG